MVPNFAHRVLVLRHGPVIEREAVQQIFYHVTLTGWRSTLHPYSVGRRKCTEGI